MNTQHLADLDELMLSCRDEKARSLMREAHACYRAGAYRSAIIATWIAVVYDLIEKLRELDFGGDAAAKVWIAGLDAAHAAGENNKLQTYENGVLDKCAKEFNFFHPIELEYLRRLFSDRNRSAHPNHVKHNELFSVSAEQARLHMRNAIELVLSQPATLGKAALNELSTLIKAPYFPSEKPKMRRVLEASPLAKPRQNLFNEFVCGITAAALSDKLSSEDVYLRIAVVGTAFDLHPTFAHDLVNGTYGRVLGKTPDDGLKWLPILACEIPLIQSAIDPALSIRLDELISKGPEREVASFAAHCLRANFKTQDIERRIPSFRISSIQKLAESGGLPLPAAAINRTLELLDTSTNWPGASDVCEVLFSVASYLDEEQIHRLFKIADTNKQITPAWNFPSLIERLRKNPLLNGEKFDTEMQKHVWGTSFITPPEQDPEPKSQ